VRVSATARPANTTPTANSASSARRRPTMDRL
jgi:hypothetical protein